MEDKVLINRLLSVGFLTIVVVCIINALIRIRKFFPVRVNCWFCNNNFWLPYPLKNSFFCQKCEQYNGFTSDGDYNKDLPTNATKFIPSTKNYFPPPNNGLCYKCNTNQQLKIKQLADFKPMNEKNFDLEIEAFKIHLEKVYQCCSTCRRYVKGKLQNEKCQFLGTKLLASRNKAINENDKIMKSLHFFQSLLRISLKLISVVFFICVICNLYRNSGSYVSKKTLIVTKNYLNTMYVRFNNSLPFNEEVINSIKDHTHSYYNLMPSFLFNIPFLDYFDADTEYYSDMWTRFSDKMPNLNSTLEILAIVGCFLQFLLHAFEFCVSFRYFVNDIAWVVLVSVIIVDFKYYNLFQILCAALVICFPPKFNQKRTKVIKSNPHRNMKNLSHKSISSTFNYDNDNDLSDESDFDTHFNKTSTPESCKSDYLNHSKFPKYNPATMKQYQSPKSINESFCRSSMWNNSAFSCRSEEPFFSKPLAKSPNTNMLSKNYNDSNLNWGINSLNLGNTKDVNRPGGGVFSTRQYNCTSPYIFMPSPTSLSRPILSPSRFTQGTQQSWVAGGYWGADNPRQLYNAYSASRSSSQSSGFESLASSAQHRNLNSFPPSREDSVSSEYNKKADNVMYNNSNNYYNYSSWNSPPKSAFQTFNPQCLPIYPNLRNNESVFISNRVPSYGSLLQKRNIHGSNGSLCSGSNMSQTFTPLHKSVFSE